MYLLGMMVAGLIQREKQYEQSDYLRMSKMDMPEPHSRS